MHYIAYSVAAWLKGVNFGKGNGKLNFVAHNF
jgi:hypothetical protein